MKKSIINTGFVLLLITIVAGCENSDCGDCCSTRYYYSGSNIVNLTELPDGAIILAYDTLTTETVNQIIEKLDGVQILAVHQKDAIVSIESENCDKTDRILEKIKKDPRVSNCGKIFISEYGSIIMISDRFVCQLKSSTTKSQLIDMVNRTNTEIVEYGKYHYIIRADKNSDGDAIDMSNKFYESGYFEYTEPVYYGGWTID